MFMLCAGSAAETKQLPVIQRFALPGNSQRRMPETVGPASKQCGKLSQVEFQNRISELLNRCGKFLSS